MELINYIWYEKHRPCTLEELVLPPAYKQKFSGYVADRNIPHLLFYGPQGSGKTTLAQILMSLVPCQKLVLNASSEDRGVATMKGKVKQFAASQPLDGALKIVLLDEFDSTTPDAQKALRNTMETYSSSCRFILTANYVDKVLPAIRSRCTQYEFSAYSVRRLMAKLSDILKKENCIADPEDLETLVKRMYPDVRSIINNLQMCCVDGRFNPQLVGTFMLDTGQLVTALQNGKVATLRAMWAGVSDFTWLYKFLFDMFLPTLTTNIDLRAKAALAIAEFMYKDSQVIDREINFVACILTLMQLLGVSIQFDG